MAFHESVRRSLPIDGKKKRPSGATRSTKSDNRGDRHNLVAFRRQGREGGGIAMHSINSCKVGGVTGTVSGAPEAHGGLQALMERRRAE